MSEYGDDLALLWCVLLNAAVFGTAYRFAIRRMTRDRVQAALDAALAGYAIQYASICLPAVLGALRPSTVSCVAMLLSALLWAGAGRARKSAEELPLSRPEPKWSSWVALIVACFAAGYALALARLQDVLPVMSNDALTYHFPAAVQWFQTGRLTLFPTWFFNPANTYSPLGGSTFIAWLIAPFDNDVLARFVQVPALAIVGVALFQLCRQLGVRLAVAALIAAAGVLARPMLFASIMGKDDLFVAAFFLLALIAMSPPRAAERFATVRLGVVLGLLVAMKYTALLSVPVLLLAIDGPWRAGWRWRWWSTAVGVAILVGGPWYWRNLWITGNPLFPIDMTIAGRHVFRGLFTPARSEGLRSIAGIWNVLTGGDYGLVPVMTGICALGWLALLVRQWRKSAPPTPGLRYAEDPDRSRENPGLRHTSDPASALSNPLVRTCLIGAPLALALFTWRSPFPEVRFVFPAFLLLFACVAVAIDTWITPNFASTAIAAVVFIAAWWTAPADRDRSVEFATSGGIVAGVGFLVFWFTRNWRPNRRWLVVGGGACAALVAYAFVNFAASLSGYRQVLFAGWDLNYPQYRPLWQYVAEHVPPDARLAYTNLYIVYPLQGFTQDRRVFYAPTRPGVHTLADLPWLGDRLPGERLVAAAVNATAANADRATWLQNLREQSAQYLLIGKGSPLPSPPEAAFAAGDSKHFKKLYESNAGVLYAIEWGE